MFKNLMKTTFRNLIKQKGYAIINITGLAIGIACCVLILLYVQDELSYDKHFENADRIYRIGMKGKLGDNNFEMAVSPGPAGYTLQKEFPEVVAATRIRTFGYPVMRYKDKAFSEEKFMWADSTYFDVFAVNFIQGDPNSALSRPESVVLTQSTARKYFGDEDPMGKIINADRNRDYLVTGVIEDPPATTHFHYDFLGSLSTYNFTRNDNRWISNNYYTYIMLNESATMAGVEDKFEALITKYAVPQIEQAVGVPYSQLQEQGAYYGMFLQKMTDIHLHSDLDNEAQPNGSAAYVYIFSVIALAILAIAGINFMNLATARSIKRAKEVGVRKTLGSSRGQLIRQFLAETLFLTSLAVMLALILVEVLLPLFNNLAGKQMQIHYFDNFITLPALFVFTLLVGLASGIYPAFFLSSFQPVKVLKSSGISTGGGASILRSGLVIFQFVISIVLFIGTFIVHSQLSFVQDKKLGFNKEQIVLVKKTDDLSTGIWQFMDELRSHSDIVSVSNSNSLPGLTFSNNVHKSADAPSNENHILWETHLDDQFAQTFEIEMVAGRFFDRSRPLDTAAVVINEAAVRLFGLVDPIGKEIISMGSTPENSTTYHVIGVMKDFHFESLHQKIRPLGFKMYRRNWFGRNIAVRVAGGNIPATLAHIESTWKKYAEDQAFEYSFFDDDFAELYAAEQRTGNLMTIFSGLAIMVACLGLLGLASFTTEQRTKEIGIRKTLGASVPRIVGLLFKEFAKWVLLANIVAWPAAYFLMNGWLQNFAYRVDISIITFIAASVLTLFVAFVTVSYQTVSAALTNPVDALRNE